MLKTRQYRKLCNAGTGCQPAEYRTEVPAEQLPTGRRSRAVQCASTARRNSWADTAGGTGGVQQYTLQCGMLLPLLSSSTTYQPPANIRPSVRNWTALSSLTGSNFTIFRNCPEIWITNFSHLTNYSDKMLKARNLFSFIPIHHSRYQFALRY